MSRPDVRKLASRPLNLLWYASLRTKVLALVAVGTAVLVLAFVFMAVDAMHKDTERSLNERLVVAQTLADRVSYTLNDKMAAIDLVARQHLLAPASFPLDGAGLAEAVSGQLNSSPVYVLLLDRSGQVAAAYPAESSAAAIAPKSMQSVYRVLALGTQEATDTVPGVEGRTRLINLVSPAYDTTGDVAGALLVALDPTTIGLGLPSTTIDVGPSALLEIVDSAGAVVSSNAKGGMLDLGDPGAHLQKLADLGKGTVGTCHGCHASSDSAAARQPQVLAFAPVDGAPWGVAFLEPENVVFASTHSLRVRMYLIGGVALLLVIAMSWVGVQRVVRPINQLTEASRRLSSGDLDTPFPVVGESEVHTLSAALEGMRKSLKGAREEAVRWQKEVQDVVELRERELAAMLTASDTLVRAEDYAGLLQTVVKTAVDASPAADAGVLFMYDEAEGVLVARAAEGYGAEELARVRLRPGESVGGYVYRDDKALVFNTPGEVENALKSTQPENYRNLLAARKGIPPQCLIAVPLRSRGQVKGSLILVGLREGTAFSQSEIRVVAAFASYAAVVIEISRLLRETGQVAALKEADKLKTEFLSNVSHELRTPLTSIRISIDSLLAGVPPKSEDPRDRLLRNIQRNVERLSALVSELLDMARLQSGRVELHREEVDLRDVVRESVDTIRPLAESKGISLDMRLPALRMAASADKGRLGQALLNLLTNATEYTPADGCITVSAHADDGHAILTVRDTGPGIPATEQSQIFERFYRGSAAGGARRAGLGLGLPIAKALVDLHGGSIWVESKVGEGTAFHISLPRKASTE